MAIDPYWKLLNGKLPDIRRLYAMHADKHPVMLFDIEEHFVYAYPYEDYRAELNERSQASLKQQYEDALANGMFVVFVRDNKNRKLKSYTVPIS